MEIKEAWGVIRPDEDGQWYIQKDDPHHRSSGIKKVSQKEYFVQIDYDFEKLTMVHWTAVTPDEQLIFNRYLVGASAGLEYTRVYFAKKGKPVSPASIKLGEKADKANFWFYLKGEV